MSFSPNEQPLYAIKADLFKGLAHPYRIRVLEILVSDDEVPVSRLIAELGLEASHLSQHLSVLRRHRLVVSERRASVVYYRLAFPEVADLLRVARLLLASILHDAQGRLDSVDDLPEIASHR